ncbi:MAG: EthD family reductase [Anaerolineales bacterium]|nr:EthD family reductase [Anaerolineales bacterium]
MSIKVVVLYPYPKDQEAFEKAYTSEHIPLVAKSLTRLTKATYSHVLMSPQGNSPFCRIAELHYASLEDLQADFSTPEAQALNVHAVSISTGGVPVSLVCDEETEDFSPKAFNPEKDEPSALPHIQ